MGRGFEGRAAGRREEEGGTWELYHSNFLAKSIALCNLSTHLYKRYNKDQVVLKHFNAEFILYL